MDSNEGENIDLEGPFLTLADFVRAQEIRERLQRRRRKQSRSAVNKDSTFSLTATGHEEIDHDIDERQSNYASDGRPATSMSMATTAQPVVKKHMTNKMVQTVPQEGPQDPDLVLRRYLFNVDWSRKVPSIEATCKCTDIYQKFRQGLKDVVARKRASKPSSIGKTQAQRDASGKDRVETEGKEKIDAKAENWVLEASKSKRNLKKEELDPLVTEKLEFPMSQEHLCFYEVKLTKDEVNPVYDYTVDYRRFSYVDFRVSDVVGSSTILPELLAEWIVKAMPRNQDDVYPLFVLCKDLLKKFCLRETRYSFKREEYLEKQVESLSHCLHECTEQSENARASFDQITSQHVLELKSLQEQLNLSQTELQSALHRVGSLEHGNKLLLRLVTALQPRCESQVHELEARMSSIRDLEKTLDSMDSAFREVALEAEAGKQQAKTQIEELEAEVHRLDAFRVDAEERLATLEGALEKANRLNAEFLEHFNSVMARQPDEVVSGMTIEQKMLFFRALLRSPDNLIMQLEEQDLLSQTVLSLRYAVCLFLREIRSKSINYESWLDTIGEALGCEPENLINTLLQLTKEAGRSANLGAMDRTSVVWSFLKREMERCNVEIDLDSFERLKEGDEDLFLKIVGNEVVSESSGDEGMIYEDKTIMARVSRDATNAAGAPSAEVGVLSQANMDSLQSGLIHDGAQGTRTIRSAHRHGHRPSSTKREIAAVRREADYIVKKYGLFDMTELRGVKGFSIEDTVAMIGAIIDFKAESDYHCDLSIRPRLNMVKVVRMYLKQRCNKREVSEAELKSLCRSVVNLQARHSLVRIFGIISGMIDTSHWTERSACFFIAAIRGVKSLDDPGAESEDPDSLDEGWLMFRTWLSDPQHVLKRSTFIKGLETACNGMFGFGPMTNLAEKLVTASTSIQSAGVVVVSDSNSEQLNPEESIGQDSDIDVYLHSALEVVMDIWLAQLDESREKLREKFVQNDINGDQELQMDEFIQLIKSTGYKMRQHDAMNMFHELAGPDDTVDQDEFSELVVFMKFNIRAILGETGA